MIEAPPYAPARAEASETSPWYNIFAPVVLESLEPSDVLFLIRNYNQNPYTYTPEAERALIAAGDRKPFDTQWLCSESVKALLAARRTRVILADVEQAIRTVVGERRREYATFWQRFTNRAYNAMNRQECYRQAYRRLKPGWKDSLTIYREMIDLHTQQDTRILDIGCGSADFLEPVYSRAQAVCGIDPDRRALNKNTVIVNRVVGMGDHVPLGDNYFDLALLTWVIEHLDHPARVFQEIYRVLKPGGRVFFLTPNVWNYNVWMIRMVPNKFHHFFTHALYDRQEDETYSVRYEMNSVKRIDTKLRSIGFKRCQLILNGDPSYISFNDLLFKVACSLEQLLDSRLLRFARVHIVGVYQK